MSRPVDSFKNKTKDQPLVLVLTSMEQSPIFAYRLKRKLSSGPVLGGAYISKTVEKLERELEKSLNPETASIEKKEPIDKSLKDKLWDLSTITENIIAGAFELTDNTNYSQWTALRRGILLSPTLRHYFDDHDFITGFHTMNEVIDRLITIYNNEKFDEAEDMDHGPTEIGKEGNRTYHWSLGSSVPRILLGATAGHQEPIEWRTGDVFRGFTKIKEAFQKLSVANFENEEQHLLVKVQLDAVLFAQKYLLDLHHSH